MGVKARIFLGGMLLFGAAPWVVATATPVVEGRTQTLNIAAFGEITHWEPHGEDYGVMWEDQREIYRVVVRFRNAVPAPDSVAIQYWQSSWPHREIPRDEPSGAGSSGWFDVGDWFQGEWRTADTELSVDGSTYAYTFRPLNQSEFPDIKDKPVQYRTTLKLRVIGKEPLPEVVSFEAYSDSEWKPLDIEIEWDPANPYSEETRIEAFNGMIERVRQTPGGGFVARVLYAETHRYNSFDETVVTVRAGSRTFSFLAVDLLKHGHILIPDLGVLVRVAGTKIYYPDALRLVQESKEKDIYTRVMDHAEQTLPDAWKDVPQKKRNEIPLSFEGTRQHFGLAGDGNVYAIKNWISRLKSTDTPRCRWSGERIDFEFGLPVSAMTERQAIDGCLPMMKTVWELDGVRYTQTAFAMPLAGVPAPGQRILAEDPLVLLVRFDMELLDALKTEAKLDFSVTSGDEQRVLVRQKNRIVEIEDKKELLRIFAFEKKGLDEIEGKTVYRRELTKRHPKATLDLAIPFITLVGDDAEWRQLKKLEFDPAFETVRTYWHGRIDAGAQVATPEPMVNDFYKAHVSHLLINTERERGGSDCYMAKVGTFHYGVFTNESCMMVSDLDRRGYRERAAQAIETWFHYQGTVGLPGDFSTTEGQFYGAGGYEHGGYNQHHGWALWSMGEHWWYFRDKAWMDHAAPYIAKGCNWIVNERARTAQVAERSRIRAIESGLLPPGRLEDIGDWRCWLSTNVYSWWGMDNAARALVDAGKPEGARLKQEADAYKADILKAFSESMRRSPVVRLRDGSWIPHIPSDVHRRGRSFGWITETLEGAIHLVRCGMLDPWDPASTWIIKDFEDNLYISEQFGYDLKGDDFERYWFGRGGISMQANLLCNPIPYLLRDQPEHFLRAYFNAFAVSFFADTRMMTEHALPNIGDWRGDHYKSSDEANSTYWLRMMFIQERGDELWLGASVPRYWLADGKKIGVENEQTYFGPMSVTLESKVSEARITMRVDLPTRNAAKRVFARFRHPDKEKMRRCEVNGQPWTAFDPAKEWVDLTGCTGSATITAYYK